MFNNDGSLFALCQKIQSGRTTVARPDFKVLVDVKLQKVKRLSVSMKGHKCVISAKMRRTDGCVCVYEVRSVCMK